MQSKVHFFLERNYSTLDKEVWPLSKELRVHSLPRTHYSILEKEFWPVTGDPGEGSLAIVYRIKSSFSTSNRLLNPREGILAIYWGH